MQMHPCMLSDTAHLPIHVLLATHRAGADVVESKLGKSLDALIADARKPGPKKGKSPAGKVR